jgi:hypothetical protein
MDFRESQFNHSKRAGKAPPLFDGATACPDFLTETKLTSYGTTKLTDVPELAKPSLVPPQVPSVRVNADPVQFGYWM